MISAFLLHNYSELETEFGIDKQELIERGYPADSTRNVWLIPMQTKGRARKLIDRMLDGSEPLGQYIITDSTTADIVMGADKMCYVLVA